MEKKNHKDRFLQFVKSKEPSERRACYSSSIVNVKVYKQVVKFSLTTKQKIFWVLVFSFMYLVSVDAMDRSEVMKYYVLQGNIGKTEKKL